MTARPFPFGKVAVACAATTVFLIIVFFLSGYILPYFTDEQGIVVTQLLSILLMPIFSIIGLSTGIVGTYRHPASSPSRTGMWLNGALLALEIIVFSLLTVSTSTIHKDPDPADRPNLGESSSS